MTGCGVVPLVDGQAAPIAGATVGAGLVFVSGLAPIDVATMAVVGDDIDTQAAHVLEQLEDVLRRAGSDLASVLRLECFLADPSDFAGWNAAFAAAFPTEPPGAHHARGVLRPSGDADRGPGGGGGRVPEHGRLTGGRETSRR